MKKRLIMLPIALFMANSLQAIVPAPKTTSANIAKQVSTFVESQGEALVAFLESCPDHEFFKKIGISYTGPDRKVAFSGKEARDQIIEAGKKMATMGAKATEFLYESIVLLQQKINKEQAGKVNNPAK